MASKVALLDPHTINQIAAGEVVERPASVAKELIENSLDAGATRIEIQIDDAGKSLLRVRDDGCGMTAEELKLALHRHATSKIRQFQDLASALSLGFRGEALPSIASVSRMMVSSGVDDSGRVQIVIAHGKIESEQIVPGSRGTEVAIEGLFENTPARLKFMKSDTAETSAIVETIGRYVIAFPAVAFTLKMGDIVSLFSPGNGNLYEALCAVWGTELCRALAEVDSHTSGISVRGFVGPPHVNRATRSHQQMFVNGRPVRSKTLYAAIDAAFRSLTPERRHAIAALSLEIDPSEIDVNVSPTKAEIRFQREGAAFDAVRLAIKSGLMEHGLMPEASPVFVGGGETPVRLGFAAAELSAFQVPNDLFKPTELVERPTSKYPFAELVEDLQVLGQTHNTFIVASTRRGLVVIDQHVAHERVLYEYLCGLKSGAPIEVQHLLSPETIEFERSAALSVAKQLDEFERVGFRLEPFGAQAFLIRAVPAAAANKDYRSLLREVADELDQASGTRQTVDAREKIWIMSACKMAVKAGDPLSIAEMEHLIQELANTENPYLCPHGRPITITLTYDEIMRRFKRS